MQHPHLTQGHTLTSHKATPPPHTRPKLKESFKTYRGHSQQGITDCYSEGDVENARQDPERSVSKQDDGVNELVHGHVGYARLYDDDDDVVDDEPEAQKEEPPPGRPEDIGNDQDPTNDGTNLQAEKWTFVNAASTRQF